jgi:cytochrome o ubiquinol oxidase subunit IV
LSAILTLDAYLLVTKHALSGNQLIAALATLAIIQLITQLVFFLHLGRESKPRWNLAVFAFMLIVLVIVVFGSLWIMTNLNYSHGQNNSPPAQPSDEDIIRDEGIR